MKKEDNSALRGYRSSTGLSKLRSRSKSINSDEEFRKFNINEDARRKQFDPFLLSAAKRNHFRSASGGSEEGGTQHEGIHPSLSTSSTFPGHLSSMFQPELADYKKSDENFKCIDFHLRRVAFCSVLAWMCLCILMSYLCPKENIEMVPQLERNAVTLAFSVQLITFCSRIVPTFLLGADSSTSSLFLISVVVQFVSMMTNLLMATFPSPVMIDPITLRRVHLFRWCEWIPLAFVMTFLTEIVGMTDAKTRIKDCYRLGFSQMISTASGILFPFANKELWGVLMIFSCFFFLYMFPRLHFKRKQFRQQKMGKSVEELETYNHTKYSYHLLLICTIMWCTLVTSHFTISIAAMLKLENSSLTHAAATMLSECTLDVLIKVVYLNVLNEIQDAIFDDKARSRRRLKELKSMMTVVWDSSSDIIIISVLKSDKGVISTMVSPTYEKSSNRRVGNDGNVHNAIVFELKASAGSNSKPLSVMFLNSSEAYIASVSGSPFFEESLTSLGKVVTKAWKSQQKESLFMHNLIMFDGSSIQSEAKLNRFEDHSLIIVLRDISERYMRFEAEKKVVSETTARRKDAEANRFTRHEVKNGLLSAIELCSELKTFIHCVDNTTKLSLESHSSNPQLSSASTPQKIRLSASFPQIADAKNTPLPNPNIMNRHIYRFVVDLDYTLHEVLDTVLAEAMSRELINELYQPVLERVDFVSTLENTLDTSHRKRFPIDCNPYPFPSLYFDKQLFKYIHRNAISNAMKYGEKGGIIQTKLQYDSQTKEFVMLVINLPGIGHAKLIAMGEASCNSVFVQGKRLHVDIDEYKECQSLSSGDGAWIVQKCAKTLGGKCTIFFEENRTVFCFKCHAEPYSSPSEHLSGISEKFRLPENTFGIAIDDSKIQRKLMEKCLVALGVRKEHRVVLGKDGEEIRSFPHFVKDLVLKHPKHFFLMIVDENLDIHDVDHKYRDETLSGSQMVEDIRRQLPIEDERRILAIIRSANDSANEFATYNERAHGFIAKVPMRVEHMNDTVRDMWIKRFRENLKTNL